MGPHSGKKISEAKPLIKQKSIDQSDAGLYYEPESKVRSRTEDECIVTATDQWHPAPGEELWQKALKDHVLDPNKFNAYDPISLPKYDHTIDWLKEWAHTPQFGLVTHLPWDPQWVIESLSNSTIYFAYYTIAQILQGKG